MTTTTHIETSTTDVAGANLDAYRDILRQEIQDLTLSAFSSEAMRFGLGDSTQEPWVEVRRGWHIHRIDLGVSAFLAPSCPKVNTLIAMVKEHAALGAA